MPPSPASLEAGKECAPERERLTVPHRRAQHLPRALDRHPGRHHRGLGHPQGPSTRTLQKMASQNTSGPERVLNTEEQKRRERGRYQLICPAMDKDLSQRRPAAGWSAGSPPMTATSASPTPLTGPSSGCRARPLGSRVSGLISTGPVAQQGGLAKVYDRGRSSKVRQVRNRHQLLR